MWLRLAKTNTVSKDKLTGSLAPAISWNGNICHKGFHMDGACGPEYLLPKKKKTQHIPAQIVDCNLIYFIREICNLVLCFIPTPKALSCICTVKIPQNRRSLSSQSAYRCLDDVIWRSSASASAPSLFFFLLPTWFQSLLSISPFCQR